MKKLLSIFLLSFVLILAACGSDEPKTEEAAKKEEKPAETKLELSETKVSFTNITIEIEKAYTKDNLLILETRFTNDSFDGELSFNAGGYIEVSQNEEQLKEVSGVTEGNSGNYFYKNKVGIHTPVTFEYELLNKEDDVTLAIGSSDFNDEQKEVTVSFQ